MENVNLYRQSFLKPTANWQQQFAVTEELYPRNAT